MVILLGEMNEISLMESTLNSRTALAYPALESKRGSSPSRMLKCLKKRDAAREKPAIQAFNFLVFSLK
jgi:hypothetical protein